MTDLEEFMQARAEGRDVRVHPHSGDPLGELKDLYRRQEALRRAVELREKVGIGKVRVGWVGDPDSFKEFDSDADLLAQVDAEIEALKRQLGRFDPPDAD